MRAIVSRLVKKALSYSSSSRAGGKRDVAVEDFEELYGKWEPKLYRAAMAQTDRHFAALVGGPRWDDPYTTG